MTANETVFLFPKNDTWISEADQGLNYGASPTIEIQNKNLENKNGLIVFDLTPFSGKTVVKASMYMHVESGVGNNAVVNAYPIITNIWNEGNGNGTSGFPNWISAQSGQNWVAAGGGFYNGVVGTLDTEISGYRVMDLNLLGMQFAIDWPSSNLGMLLKGTAASANEKIVITSKEGAVSQRPYLVLEFESDPNTSVCNCLLYTSPSPRDATLSRMPSSA